MNNDSKKAIKSLLTYFIIFYFGASLITMLLTKILTLIKIDYLADGGKNITAWINFLTYVAIIIPLVILNYKDLKTEITEMKNTKGYGKIILLSFLIGYGANYLISVYSSDITNRFNEAFRIFGKDFISSESDNQKTIVAILHSDGAFITFISAALIGPLVEELVYRKSIFGIIKDKELALFISATFFSLSHIISSIGYYNIYSILLMFFTYFLPGLAFGYIYYKNNNIWYSVFAHMIMNTISVILILLMY